MFAAIQDCAAPAPHSKQTPGTKTSARLSCSERTPPRALLLRWPPPATGALSFDSTRRNRRRNRLDAQTGACRTAAGTTLCRSRLPGAAAAAATNRATGPDGGLDRAVPHSFASFAREPGPERVDRLAVLKLRSTASAGRLAAGRFNCPRHLFSSHSTHSARPGETGKPQASHVRKFRNTGGTWLWSASAGFSASAAAFKRRRPEQRLLRQCRRHQRSAGATSGTRSDVAGRRPAPFAEVRLLAGAALSPSSDLLLLKLDFGAAKIPRRAGYLKRPAPRRQDVFERDLVAPRRFDRRSLPPARPAAISVLRNTSPPPAPA